VKSVRVRGGGWPTGVAREAVLEFVTENQGHARNAPWVVARLQQARICGTERGAPLCLVACDGGAMPVAGQDAQGPVCRTDCLPAGTAQAWAGVLSTAEAIYNSVSYRLFRVADPDGYGM
jgi:hypothetical protein